MAHKKDSKSNHVSEEGEALTPLQRRELNIAKYKEHVAKLKEEGKQGRGMIPKGMALNPLGRTKGSKNFKTILNAMLDGDKVPYWDDDKKKIIMQSKRTAVARRILDKALTDDNVAWTKLLIDSTEAKETEGMSSKPVINVNIANFKDMSIDDLLNTAGNPPNESNAGVQG